MSVGQGQRQRRRQPAGALERLAEAVGLTWALGMALYTAVYFVFYLVGVPAGLAIAPALVVAVVWGRMGLSLLREARGTVNWTGGSDTSGSIRGSDSSDSSDDPRGPQIVLVAAAGIAALQIVVTVWIATHSLLRRDDAWTVWAWKAHLVALGGFPHGYFTSYYWTAHPDYPLNLALAEAPLLRLPTPVGLTMAALVATGCFVALLLIYYAGLTRLYGRTIAALATAALTLAPSLPQFAGYGFADVPVALYSGAGALYLLVWWRERRQVDAILMGLLAGAAIWTKKEGLPLALLLLLAYAIDAARAGAAVRRVLAVGAATLALPLPWLIFARMTRPPGSDFYPISLGVFVANVGRLPTIVLLFLREALSVEHWSLFWVIVFVSGGVALAVRRLRPGGAALFALLAAQIGVYLVGYVFSDWSPFIVHIGSSLNRLMIQAVPLALLVTVEAVCSLPLPPAFDGPNRRPTSSATKQSARS